MWAAALPSLALLIEAAGSAYIVWAVAQGLYALLRGAGPERARLLVADGVVAALGFKTAATLLRSTYVQGWAQIGLFAAVLLLRTVIRGFLTWEAAQLRRGS